MAIDPQLLAIHELIRRSGRHPVQSGKQIPFMERLEYEQYSRRRLDAQIERSLTIVADAFAIAPPEHWCVSVSFGKDSVVLWDILTRRWPDLTCLFVDRSEEAEFPETPLVIDALQAYRPFRLEIVRPEITILQLYAELGGIPGITSTASESIIRERTLGPPADAWRKEHGYVGHFMGRRIDENKKTRGKHLQVRGPLHFNKGMDAWTCDPLARWTATEIWAYTVRYDLPYHPVYDLEPDRKQARMASWPGVSGAHHGRWVVLKKHYPELWSYFVQRFPEASQYV